jgi:transcriptional regulator with XRE-family HTH domain
MDRQTEALAEFLQQKRIEAGIDQQTQARLIGIEPPELTRYIKGKRRVTPRFLQQLLEAYGKSTKDIKDIYRTQISQDEIGRAETIVHCGAEKHTPIDLAVWLKFGV